MPFTAVAPVDSLDEALDLANDSVYGLTAGLLQRGPGRGPAVPRHDRGRRAVREPPGRRDDRRVAGHPAVRRLEGERLDRQVRPSLYYVAQFMREQSQHRRRLARAGRRGRALRPALRAHAPGARSVPARCGTVRRAIGVVTAAGRPARWHSATSPGPGIPDRSAPTVATARSGRASRESCHSDTRGRHGWARLYSGRNIQSAYSLCTQPRGGPCRRARRGSPGPAASRTSSPSCPAPRPGRTSRSTRPGRRRACRAPTRSCRSAARAWPSRTSTATCSSTSRPGSRSTRPATRTRRSWRRSSEQAAELIHFSASDFYLPIYPRGLPRARADRADRRPRPRLPRQLRHGGRRGRDQARPLRDEAAVPRGLPRRVPRPDLRLGLPDRVQGEVPRRVRAAAAGRLPRAVRPGRGPALVRRGPVRQARAGRTRSPRSSSSRSRARAATSSPRTASSRACARSATSTASCSSPTRSSRAPGGPARCGRSSTGASSPTSC